VTASRLGIGGALALGTSLLGIALSGMAGLDARIAAADHQRQRLRVAPKVQTVPVSCLHQRNRLHTRI
jgi:hypothetical protein